MQRFLLSIKSLVLNKKNGSVKLHALNFILGFAVICGFWVAGQATRTPEKEAYANIIKIAYLPIWLTSSANNYCNSMCYDIIVTCPLCHEDPDNAENSYNVDCDCANDCGCLPCGTDCERCSSDTRMVCGSSSKTEEEWFEEYFGDCLDSPVCIIGECDNNYICHAYAKNPSNPPYDNAGDVDLMDSGDILDGIPTLTDMDLYYSNYNRTSQSDPDVVIRVYENNDGDITHSDRDIGNGRYESKLGYYYTIRHGSNELTCKYGTPTYFYEPK